MYDGLGFHGLVDHVRADFTSNVAITPWLRSECHAASPPDLLDCMRRVLKSRNDELEEASKSCLSAHAKHIDSCRLPPRSVADELRSSLERAIKDAAIPQVVGLQAPPGPDGAVMLPAVKYVGVELEREGAARLARALIGLLPGGDAHPARGTLKQKYHVTLWHHQAHGPLPPNLEGLEGAQCSVVPLYVAADERCVCCAVRLGEPVGAACRNDVAHVTVWTAEGTPNKYSNELLGRVAGGGAREGAVRVEVGGEVAQCSGVVSFGA